MIAAGTAMTTIGGAGVIGGVMLALFPDQEEAGDSPFSDRRRNGVAIALLGTTLVGAGIPILVQGARRVPVIDPKREPTSPVLIYREPIPDGYHSERRSSRGLMLAGSLLLLFSYSTSFQIALRDPHDHAAFLPLVGPFVASVQTVVDDRSTNADDQRRHQAKSMLYAWSGLVQTAGFALLAAGVHGGEVLVRDPPRGSRSGAQPRSAPTLRLGLGHAEVTWRF